jgi:hypothetical protein
MWGFPYFIFVVVWITSLFWQVSLVYYCLCILAFLVSDSFFMIYAKCIDLWAICEKIYSDSIWTILRVGTIRTTLAAPECLQTSNNTHLHLCILQLFFSEINHLWLLCRCCFLLCCVWWQLEQIKPLFFKACYMMLMLKNQIMVFNRFF